MTSARTLLLVASCSAMSACLPDLGPCDTTRARAIVYDDDGLPSFEGQALLRVSCGNGSSCHSADALGTQRRGVPHGFDFDVTPIDAPESEREEAALGNGTATVRGYSREILGAVTDGSMPPFGTATRDAFAMVPRYVREDGTRLPWIDSVEGVDVLRNWLACDAPIVERTAGESRIGGDVVPAR